MNDSLNKNNLTLIFVIVYSKMASKILKYSKKCGISGGTIFYGTGTIPNNKILGLLGFDEVNKEIVLMLGEKEVAYHTLEMLNVKFKLYKPNHGIAFALPVSQILGSNLFSEERRENKVEKPKYNLVFTIVDRGNAERVIDAAILAGSKGGTIINARGSGIHETSKLFNMEISPEKEVVLIVCDSLKTDQITKKIYEELEIEKPGNGIIFVQDVDKAYGLYNNTEL